MSLAPTVNGYTEDYRIVLPQSRIPTAWYNVLADMPVEMPPALHPGSGQPLQPADWAPLFPMGLIEQEYSRDRYIPIPEELRDIYRQPRTLTVPGLKRFNPQFLEDVSPLRNRRAEFADKHPFIKRLRTGASNLTEHFQPRSGPCRQRGRSEDPIAIHLGIVPKKCRAQLLRIDAVFTHQRAAQHQVAHTAAGDGGHDVRRPPPHRRRRHPPHRRQ